MVFTSAGGVWMPALYTSPVMFMVKHHVSLPGWVAALIFAAGLASIIINYWADRQRQMVRSTNGSTTIWGKDPVLIQAHSTTETGEKKKNLLLVSGFWGISSHFHYGPKLWRLFLEMCYRLLFFRPVFYVTFLVALLTHRSFRDEAKFSKKYGKHWDEYRKIVPYKITPKAI